MTSIHLAQIDPLVGDLKGNIEQMANILNQHVGNETDLWVFPEFSICGYPPQDLLLSPQFIQACEAAAQQLASRFPGAGLLLSYPTWKEGKCYNTLAFWQQRACQVEYHKRALPNEGVFDEKRYFTPGTSANHIIFHEKRLGLAICEDLWDWEVAQTYRGLDGLIVVNASPFDWNKIAIRKQLIRERSQSLGLPIFSCHQVGAQDELIFDGGTLCSNTNGEIRQALRSFETGILSTTFECTQAEELIEPNFYSQIFQALCLGLRDYCHKNGIQQVIIGLSGGIDSALVAVIAAQALGKEAIRTYFLRGPYSTTESEVLATAMAQALGVNFECLDIQAALTSCQDTLGNRLDSNPHHLAQQNLQSRLRGLYLMALANATPLSIVLNTSNKSELALGYGTLYGDLIGALSVIGDLSKNHVYALAHYTQHITNHAIPEAILTRPPSAELAPNQIDEQELGNYESIDQWINQGMHQRNIALHKESTFFSRLQKNQFKRHQAPPILKVSPRSFGTEWRWPITCTPDKPSDCYEK